MKIQARLGSGRGNKVASALLLALVPLAVMLLVAGCGGEADATTSSSAPSSTQTTSGPIGTGDVQVAIKDYTYLPTEITIQVGQSVTWKNEDSVRHDVASDDGESFDGPLLGQGETFTFTFDSPGTYPYHCTPHPFMKATVVVQ